MFIKSLCALCCFSINLKLLCIVCVDKACRALGVHLGQLGGTCGEVFPAAHGQVCRWSLGRSYKICIPLMPFESPICLSPRLFPPPSHLAYDFVLWMGQERMSLFRNISHSWRSKSSLIHPPLSPWEKAHA